MQDIRLWLALATPMLLFGCADTVMIPAEDSTPPEVKLTAIATGENRGSVDSSNNAVTAYQLASEDSALLASGHA